MIRRTPLLIGTGGVVAGVVAGAVVGGGVLSGASATGSPTASTSTSATCHPRLASMPAALRADIRAARKLPADQRRLALRDVRAKALAGGYGTAVQRWAEQQLVRHARRWEQMPTALKQQLLSLRGDTPQERKAAMKQIRADELAGKYGTTVQGWAQAQQQRREACHPSSSTTTS